MRTRYGSLGLLALAVLSGPAEEPPAPLTVDAAVAAALAHSPELAAAEQAVEQARAAAGAAGAWSGPRLQISPLVSDVRGLDIEAVLSLTLYDPTLSPSARVARSGLVAAALDLEAARLTIASAARAAYHRLAAAEHRLAVAADDVALASELVDAATTMRDLGERPGVDVLRAELELGLAEQRSSEELAAVAQARAALNGMLGRAAQDPLAVDPNTTLAPPELEPAGLLAQALQRPHLRSAEARVQQLQAGVGVVRAQRSPAVGLEGFREDEEHGLRITVDVPLFDGGRVRGEERAAEAAVRVAEQEYAAARRQVALAVEEARLAATAATAQRERFRTSVVDRAARLVELTQLGYRAGELNLLDVLDVRRRLAEARLRQAELDEAVVRALLDLERAVGASLPVAEPPAPPIATLFGPPAPAAVFVPAGLPASEGGRR